MLCQSPPPGCSPHGSGQSRSADKHKPVEQPQKESVWRLATLRRLPTLWRLSSLWLTALWLAIFRLAAHFRICIGII